MKSVLKSLYHLGTLPDHKKDYRQKLIRDIEWNAISKFIPEGAKFLDVGCGAGYNLKLAMNKGCEVTGIDPVPYGHGVGRVFNGHSVKDGSDLNIINGDAENIPFPNNEFDVVYSSHVLEHIKDENKALQEMKRVLKNDGILIIGMPTATMAYINLFSQLIFNTHKRIIHLLRQLVNDKRDKRYRAINILVPRSHSFNDKTIFYDLKKYKIKNWRKVISSVFNVLEEQTPALYPYPDFVQLFKLRKSKKWSSSVFFICSKI